MNGRPKVGLFFLLEDFNEDIYKTLGFRPHLYHPRFGELGCTIGFEAAVPGGLAVLPGKSGQDDAAELYP
ncbi:MAG: hypothetical protein KAS61_04460 [Spirochaetes bacterium]|nr:hypothetical protein [Spirochaetota bacterium]